MATAQSAPVGVKPWRIEVSHTRAVDLADVVSDREGHRRILQRLRASDDLFKDLQSAIAEYYPTCRSSADDIRERMSKSVNLDGKAVWTETFLERHAPFVLPLADELHVNGAAVPPRGALLQEPGATLADVYFQGSQLSLFREGTFTCTIHLSIGGTGQSSVDVTTAIERLKATEEVVQQNCTRLLVKALAASEMHAVLHHLGIEVDGHNVAPAVGAAREHRILFVDRFTRTELEQNGGTSQHESAGSPRMITASEVKASPALAGLLNTASWFAEYDPEYLARLSQKDIGYRRDEIYISDRRSTLICHPGFWSLGAPGHPQDPLSLYKWDLILGAEYQVSRAALVASALDYYQTHADVEHLESDPPLDALGVVVAGKAAIARLEESLSLPTLVQHGFTRLYQRRLQEELGSMEALTAVRRRVEDAAASIELRSSVTAAENTSRESLRASLTNNTLQKIILTMAILGILTTLITAFVLPLMEDENNVIYCASGVPPKITIQRCPYKAPVK